MRQVTHALLTRPPLGVLKSIRKLHLKYLVRLACVRHAASVHPEPGSNSQIKVYFLMKFPAQTNHYLNIWLGLLLVLIRVN